MASDTEPAKLLLPYLQRADELQKHEPLVAYYCRLYAMEKGLRIPPKERTKTTNSLLVSLMNQLEKDKKAIKLGPEDNLYVEGFASNVFARADKQDRAGRADLNTAKTFYAASIFFEILTQFGEQPPDIEQKQKYAIWKAADIRKALKEGRKPEPGPPGGDQDLSSPSTSTPNSYDLGPNNIPTIPQGTDTFKNVDKVNLQPPASPPYSSPDHPSGDFSPAHPKTESPPHHYGKIPHQRPYPTEHQSMPQNYPSNDDPQNYHPHDTISQDYSSQDPNIYGSRDGTPQSYSSHEPPQSHSSHETFPQNYPSYETSSQNYPSNEGSFPPYSYPSFQSYPSFNDSTLPPAPGHYPSHYQGSDSAHHAQRTTPSNHTPPVQYNSGSGSGTQTVNTPPPAPTYTYDSNYQPSVEKIAEAHKAARFAVGALAFDDVPVAVDFLRRSLELLTNPSAGNH